MKPRLKFMYGLWNCYMRHGYCGCGYTPKQAYDDWLFLSLKVAA